jgi:hypothetical protein
MGGGAPSGISVRESLQNMGSLSTQLRVVRLSSDEDEEALDEADDVVDDWLL